MSWNHSYITLNCTSEFSNSKWIFFSFLIFLKAFLAKLWHSKHFSTILQVISLLIHLWVCVVNIKSLLFVPWPTDSIFLDENFSIEPSIRIYPLRVLEVLHCFKCTLKAKKELQFTPWERNHDLKLGFRC